jgi:hypothetical protein
MQGAFFNQPNVDAGTAAPSRTAPPPVLERPGGFRQHRKGSEGYILADRLSVLFDQQPSTGIRSGS